MKNSVGRGGVGEGLSLAADGDTRNMAGVDRGVLSAASCAPGHALPRLSMGQRAGNGRTARTPAAPVNGPARLVNRGWLGREHAAAALGQDR